MGVVQRSGQRHSPNTTGQTPSRALEVQSILNPSQPEGEDVRVTQHGPVPGRPTPPQVSTSSSRLLPPPNLSPTILKRSQPGSPRHDAPSVAQPTGPRRTLTPVSRRAPSGIKRSLTGPIHPSEGRIYTAQPGLYPFSDVPPLPNPSILDRRVPATSHSIETSQESARIGGAGEYYGTLQSTSRSASRSGSPNTSPPSNRQFGSISPPARYGIGNISQGRYQESPTINPTSLRPLASLGDRPPTNRSSYQMTINTEHGPMILPVEVDIQQASKAAAEKRRRNASASARFRKRRKEKEVEASQTISSLEKEISDLSDERDFYINERNYFRDFIVRTLGPHQLPPRPPSPPPRPESPSVIETESSLTEAPPRRTQRRRTGDYPQSINTQSSASPMLPPQSAYLPPYHPQSSLGPGQGLPPPQLAYPEARALPPNPPPSLPVTRSLSHDPFRSDLYDRSWNPGR